MTSVQPQLIITEKQNMFMFFCNQVLLDLDLTNPFQPSMCWLNKSDWFHNNFVHQQLSLMSSVDSTNVLSGK